MNDNYYLRYCLDLAEMALGNDDPPVGAVLVYQDQIIGRGIESGRSSGDITNHAEIEAIRDAIKNTHAALLGQSTLYTTHEPCIMCSYLIRHHKIPRIVFGVSVPDVGGFSSDLKVLTTTSVPKWTIIPEITSGVLEAECLDLNRRFLERINLKK